MAIEEQKKTKNIKFTCSIHGPIEVDDAIAYIYSTEKDGAELPWFARMCSKCLNELYINLAEKGVVGKVDYEVIEES